MNEMIERAALAASKARIEFSGREAIEEPAADEFTMAIARAVIASIREPTEAMLGVASRVLWEFSPDYAPTERDPEGKHPESAEFFAKAIHQAMIDEVLK